MALIKDQGIVLRPIDYSETSQILVVLTRAHGKLRFIGKGIKRSTRKRFAPAVDVLDVGDLAWASRGEGRGGLLTLTDWAQRGAHVGLRDALQRLYPALYAGEATSEMLLDEDPHPQLFDALVALLDRLAGAADGLPELCRYQRILLEEVGLAPCLEACVACGRASFSDGERVYFSSGEGGLLCRDCEAAYVEKRGLQPSQVAMLRDAEPALGDAGAAFDLLDYHITYQLGKALRLAAFVRPGRARRTPPQAPRLPKTRGQS